MALTEAEIKEREHRYITEAFGEGNLDLIDEVIAADFVGHQPTSFDDVEGPEDYKEFYTEFQSAFPDLEATVELQVAEGNRIAQLNRHTGTHTGDLMSIPPTGKSIDITAIDIKEYNDDGKAVEGWGHGDFMGLRQQLGLTFPAIIGQLPTLAWGKLKAKL